MFLYQYPNDSIPNTFFFNSLKKKKQFLNVKNDIEFESLGKFMIHIYLFFFFF